MPCLAPCSMCAHPDPCTSHADTPHIQVVQLASRLSSEHFTLHSLTAKTMTEKLLSVCDARKPLREAQMTSIGCSYACSLDWCKRVGEKAGGTWAATLTNDEGHLVLEAITKTVSIQEIEAKLSEVGKRENFHCKVVTIDNVPTTSRNDAVLVATLKRCLGAEWVAQDRFHVMHNITPDFNNQDPDFFRLVTLNLRNLVTRRDPDKEEMIDLLLREGKVSKRVKFGSATFEVKIGQQLAQSEIEYYKEIGVYHEMFSTSPCAMPEPTP